MMYVDNTNFFLSADHDSLDDVNSCLEDTSYTIGCKFNLPALWEVCLCAMVPMGRTSVLSITLPGAFTLAPGSALWILGIWIGSTDEAAPCWKQILTHNCCLIGQRSAISTSIHNRTLIAKALLLSHCYYLLDGNGAPSKILKQINNIVC